MLDVTRISLSLAVEAVVEQNRLSNGTRFSGAGIAADSSSRNLVVGNRITGYILGVFTSNTGTTAQCRDNFFANADIELSGCLDVAHSN